MQQTRPMPPEHLNTARPWRALRILLVALVAPWVPSNVEAQPQSHAYGLVGAGPTVLAAGADWLVTGGPVAVQAEAGFFGVSLGGAYHFARRQSWERVQLFVSAGYLSFSDLNHTDVGVRFGGGLIYWGTRHVGLRVDAFGFLPIEERIRTSHGHWGLRGGVGVAWR